MAIDTLEVAKRLRETGFTELKAEAVIAAVQEGTESTDLASKADLKAEIGELRAQQKAMPVIGFLGEYSRLRSIRRNAATKGPNDYAVPAIYEWREFVNRNTAKALGLTIPPSILARADEVIE